MTEQVNDHAVRQQVLQCDQSFIIQAPAGSGKTGLLIKRYLRLLTRVEAPEEIIAITFTRKAAAEMQGRILQALHEAMAGSEPESAHERESYRLASAALKRNDEKGWDIVHNPGRLRIQTIDSLCATLTRQMPLLAQLGSQPEIVENPRPLYEQAAINTLAELESGEGWSDAIANLVFHLDNDLPRIKTLIVDMLMKRDQWMPYVLQRHDRDDMQQALRRLLEEQLHVIKNKFPAGLEAECVELLRYAAANLKLVKPGHPLVCCESLDQFPTATADDLPVWQALKELLLTKQNNWRKRLDVNGGFPAATERQIDSATSEHRQSMKLKMQSLLQQLQEEEGLQAVLQGIGVLPAASYNDDEWRIVNALCELLRLAAAQLNLMFAERNQMDFIGVAEKAVQALGSDDAPTELARHLDYQVQHLLVDEFQDVSMSQARLIKALTREWSLDDGRTLFLVGDPMQSIYRFREADVSIFIRTFHDGYLGHVQLQALKLGVNFRSRQALIGWINDSFNTLFPRRDDIIAGAVSYSRSDAFDQTSTDNHVSVYPLYGRSFQQEAATVSDIVTGIQQKHPGDSIAILVRGRTHLREIVPALRDRGLRFQALDIERLDTRAPIQDLLALTRAWLYPADRVAWLACLRAPWCGLSLQSMTRLCHIDKHRLLLECLRDDELLQTLTTGERQRAVSFLQVFDAGWAERQRTTLRHAIESLWCQLGGPATLHSHNDLQNCETYFALLESLETGGTIDRLEELLQGVDELFAAPDEMAGQQLQVMTIHKAKGLEFDHVILPGLGRSTRMKTDELLVWLLRERDGYEDLILAPIREAGSEQSPVYRYINATDKEKQRYEDQRLLYVACTRSRNTLHLLGHARVREQDGDTVCEADSRSLLANLWPAVMHDYQQHCPRQADNAGDQSAIVISQDNSRLSSDWQLPSLPADLQPPPAIFDEVLTDAVIEFEWAGETIKHIGSVVHRVLQWIAEQGLECWDASRVEQERPTFAAALGQLGVPSNERDRAVQRVCLAVNNTLEDERGKWMLSAEHQDPQNEYAISGLHEGSVVNAVLDRTFVDSSGLRWIIDYKTSRHEGTDLDGFLDQEQERYQEKLKMYGLLMQQLGAEPVCLALYFPLLQGWREWRLE